MAVKSSDDEAISLPKRCHADSGHGNVDPWVCPSLGLILIPTKGFGGTAAPRDPQIQWDEWSPGHHPKRIRDEAIDAPEGPNTLWWLHHLDWTP